MDRDGRRCLIIGGGAAGLVAAGIAGRRGVAGDGGGAQSPDGPQGDDHRKRPL